MNNKISYYNATNLFIFIRLIIKNNYITFFNIYLNIS